MVNLFKIVYLFLEAHFRFNVNEAIFGQGKTQMIRLFVQFDKSKRPSIWVVVAY